MAPLFLIRAGSAEVHQLPDGGILRGGFHGDAVFDALDGGSPLETEVAALEAHQLCGEADNAREQVDEVLPGDVAAAVVGDPVEFTGRCLVFVDHLVVDGLAGVVIDVFVLGQEFQRVVFVVTQDLAALGQHEHIKFLVAVLLLGGDPGGDDLVIADLCPAPVPVVHQLEHGNVAPVVVMVAAALQMEHTLGVGHIGNGDALRGGREPVEVVFFLVAEVDGAALAAPGRDGVIQGDGRGHGPAPEDDAVVLQIALHVALADADVAFIPGVEALLDGGVDLLLEFSAVGQRQLDGGHGLYGTVHRDGGLGIEENDELGAVGIAGIEVPPFIGALASVGAHAVLPNLHLVADQTELAVVQLVVGVECGLDLFHGIFLLVLGAVILAVFGRKCNSLPLLLSNSSSGPGRWLWQAACRVYVCNLCASRRMVLVYHLRGPSPRPYCWHR